MMCYYRNSEQSVKLHTYKQQAFETLTETWNSPYDIHELVKLSLNKGMILNGWR